MAKKFGKFLLFSAAVGAAAAGVYYYLQNKNTDDFDFDDEELDDEKDTDSQDCGAKDAEERSYVDLDLKSSETEAAPEQETATVEEFFNDENDETKTETTP